jgi:hypothetical protein
MAKSAYRLATIEKSYNTSPCFMAYAAAAEATNALTNNYRVLVRQSLSKPMEDGLPTLMSTTDITFASLLSSLLRNRGISAPFQPSETSIHRAVYAAVVYCIHTSRMLE